MPTYPFKCVSCEFKQDFVLSVSQCTDIQKCPKCSSDMNRLYDYAVMHTWTKDHESPVKDLTINQQKEVLDSNITAISKSDPRNPFN